MSLGNKTQDPSDRLDYTISWAKYLSGDTITGSVWNAPGLTKSGETFGTSATSVFLAGGTAGQTYTVTNTITTALGRIIERSFTLSITQL